jgi:hypothetical protein
VTAKSFTRSFSAGTAPKIDTTFLTMAKEKSNFSKNWLNDPSTYPLLLALAGAMALAGGVMASCLAYSPDVRISDKTKHATVRTWGLH